MAMGTFVAPTLNVAFVQEMTTAGTRGFAAVALPVRLLLWNPTQPLRNSMTQPLSHAAVIFNMRQVLPARTEGEQERKARNKARRARQEKAKLRASGPVKRPRAVRRAAVKAAHQMEVAKRRDERLKLLQEIQALGKQDPTPDSLV